MAVIRVLACMLTLGMIFQSELLAQPVEFDPDGVPVMICPEFVELQSGHETAMHTRRVRLLDAAHFEAARPSDVPVFTRRADGTLIEGVVGFKTLQELPRVINGTLDGTWVIEVGPALTRAVSPAGADLPAARLADVAVPFRVPVRYPRLASHTSWPGRKFFTIPIAVETDGVVSSVRLATLGPILSERPARVQFGRVPVETRLPSKELKDGLWASNRTEVAASRLFWRVPVAVVETPDGFVVETVAAITTACDGRVFPGRSVPISDTFALPVRNSPANGLDLRGSWTIDYTFQAGGPPNGVAQAQTAAMKIKVSLERLLAGSRGNVRATVGWAMLPPESEIGMLATNLVTLHPPATVGTGRGGSRPVAL